MPISRMSDAIFHRPSAIARRPPWAAITASSVAWAWKWLGASRTGRPVSSESRWHARAANSGWALIPVPTAVPPSGTVRSSSRAACARRIASSTWPAYPANSWPSRIGVASWRWVRPVLTMPQNSSALAASARLELDERGDQLLLDRDRTGRAGGRSGSTSFELWQRLTSSLGWTFDPSRAAAMWRDDLVHVGVGRGARAGLVDVDGELGVVPAVGDLARRGGDRLGLRGVEQAEALVRLGRGELDERQRRAGTAAASAGPRSGS